jgi:hypothetical protein
MKIEAEMDRQWAEHQEGDMPKPLVEPRITQRREDDTLTRVRRVGREEALWEVVSLLNRAVTDCRDKGQATGQLEEVRAAVRKMAGG